MAVHLHPTAPLADRVLLPGDPGRALSLAQQLMHAPRMFNHNRGLWGYSGDAVSDGEPLTIQATGMGGPSAAIVISELADLGARTLLRVGTCGALDPRLSLGEVVVVTTAVCGDGASRALGADERVSAAPELASALPDADAEAGAPGVRRVICASTDLFYDPRADSESRWASAGAEVVEMETATLFTLGELRSLQAGSLLAVSDLLVPERVRIDEEGLRDAERRLGELAMRALARG